MSAQIRFGGVTPIIPAQDVEKTLVFYQERLGFEPILRAGEPTNYAGARRHESEIRFFQCNDHRIAEWTACRVSVEAIDALYGHCQSHGIVPPNGPLEKKQWGTREFTVLDLNGVALTFWQQS